MLAPVPVPRCFVFRLAFPLLLFFFLFFPLVFPIADGVVKELVDHFGQPLGLPGNLLEPDPRAGRQLRLGKRGCREREHGGDRFAHVMACFA